MKALIVCNGCYGTTRTGCFYNCDQVISVLENIGKISNEYDYCFIANDEHSKGDREFRYLPKHMMEYEIDRVTIPYLEDNLKCPTIKLTKRVFSAIGQQHNRSVIQGYGFKEICVGGFMMSFDVLATCFDAIRETDSKLTVRKNCVGDFTNEDLKNGLGIADRLGILV